MNEGYSPDELAEDEGSGKPPKRKFGKFVVIFIIINICFLAAIGRLAYVQGFSADKYRALAKKQHETRVTLRAERGSIMDRKGRLLATSVQCVSFAADPTVLKDPKDIQRIASAIEKSTGVPAADICAKIEAADGSFVWLVRGVPPTNTYLLDTIKTPGFIKLREPKRNYIYGSGAAQVIGTTDVDNIGLAGLEKSLDTLLSGTAGYMNVYRDALGKLRPSPDLAVVPAVHGNNLRLTLDIDLQRIVEFELMEGVVRTLSESGTAIAIEPKTGKVLAMATYPVYSSGEDNKASAVLTRNRAIQDAYEPGSTFKIVAAASALEEGMINPESMVNAHGGTLDLGTYKITDDKPLGMIPFTAALEYSSNIVFSTVALEMPDAKLYKYVRDFGFGLTSGIDLPGELPGKTRKIEEFDEPTKRFLGFGYGIATTPLQILNAYSAIANGGQMMKPYIIEEIQDADGNAVKSFQPEKVRRVVSEKTAETLTDMLCSVVERGTGQNARLAGIRIAGKTGTSQQLVDAEYSKQAYNASFVGYFPADDPKVAILVLLDKPKGDYHGGAVAAPIFANITKRWLAISDDFPEEASRAGVGRSESDWVHVPDLCGLFSTDANAIAKNFGLKVSCETDSNLVVVQQSPRAGTFVRRSELINVRTKNKNDRPASNTAKQPALPNVVGLSVRRALLLVHSYGVRARVEGSGMVAEQSYSVGKNGEPLLTLICRSE